jgi:hypothetical protein
MLWEDIQRAAEAAEKKLRDPDVLKCPKCGSDFFTIEEYKRYRIDQTFGLCQSPADHPQSPSFFFYKCICGEIIEPPLSMGPGPITTMYTKFIDTVKKVLSK